MFNALVWSFDFDLRDMSNEVRVSAIDWLFLFVFYFLIGSFPWLLNERPDPSIEHFGQSSP
jgi:hypothetical protein